MAKPKTRAKVQQVISSIMGAGTMSSAMNKASTIKSEVAHKFPRKSFGKRKT